MTIRIGRDVRDCHIDLAQVIDRLIARFAERADCTDLAVLQRVRDRHQRAALLTEDGDRRETAH